jgi:hypothetical protein
MAVTELTDKNPDGTRLGQSTTDLVAFWGKTPTSQASGAAQAALTITTIVNSASVSNLMWGFSTSAAVDGLIATVNALRNALVDAGIVKGSA